MNESHLSLSLQQKIVTAVIIVVLLGGAAAASEYRLRTTVAVLEQRNDAKLAEYASSSVALSAQIKSLRDTVLGVSNQSNDLSSALQNVQSQSTAVNEQIGKIYDTASTLTKLSKTDPQLLQKYSKVYFLNEHYVPATLAGINSLYAYNKGANYQLEARVAVFMNKLLSSATSDGIHLQVLSAYRSFATQAALKSGYKVTYGVGTANQFSADQGYSEHQLGTTVDFTNPTVGDRLDGFDGTAEYKWLTDNAYKYGFVLSYPKNNAYYQYEPWHWRYVGVDLAIKLHNEGKYFYDLDQRTINDYLSVMFDN